MQKAAELKTPTGLERNSLRPAADQPEERAWFLFAATRAD